MSDMEIVNSEARIRVTPDSELSIHLRPEGQFSAQYPMCSGTVSLTGRSPLMGLCYYDLPCAYESTVIRVEGVALPVLQRSVGIWPDVVSEDDLDAYPHLHMVAERKTASPWRFERWYTLVGSHLLFEGEQYFERARPPERGKSWERFIVQLRQLINLTALVGYSGDPTHVLA